MKCCQDENLFPTNIKIDMTKNSNMKTISKNNKVIITSIVLFVALMSAAFITISVIFSKNSTHVLSGFIRVECQDGSEVNVVVQEKNINDENKQFTRLSHNPNGYVYGSIPIFQKTFSEITQSENLTPIVFSSAVGICEYGYKITLTNTKGQDIDYSINLVQKGTEKDCCLPDEIEVSHSVADGFEVGTKCDGTINKNQQKSIVFLFRSTKPLGELSASPSSEFEILIKTMPKN